MVDVAEIKWGKYQEFEGPVYYGKHKYVLPESASEGEEQLLVLTTTEGGTYDAYNGYDVCISTSGLIQWCDKAPYFLVCKLLGYVADRNVGLLKPLVSLAQETGYTFKKNAKNEWRWFGEGHEVSTQEQQRDMVFAGATGKKDSFNATQVLHAKKWAAALSTVWENPEAQRYQREYTIPRLNGFQTSSAQKVVQASRDNDSPYAKTFRAAFTSFAANNPAKTSQAVDDVVRKMGVRFDKAWVLESLRSMTFSPNIAIYPHRYDKIRPVLEKLYGVDLPDFAKELEGWRSVNDFRYKYTPKGIQLALLALGYDIGTAGADGIFGKRTKDALRAFEKSSSLVPASRQDGEPDEFTVPALADALKSKNTAVNFEAA
jgi:hypothetical protein